jgi:3-carboxymuconate cyclase
MRRGGIIAVAFLLGSALAVCGAAAASEAVKPKLAVMGDQSVRYDASGARFMMDEPGVGVLSLIDLSADGGGVREVSGVPASYFGPPTGLAFYPAGAFVLVTSSQRVVRSDGAVRHVPDSRITLVRLDGTNGPAVVGELAVGSQPTSVAFSPDGRFAYVTNRGDGTLSVIECDFAAERPAMRERGRVTLGRPDELLSHIEISRDGRRGLATLTGDGKDGSGNRLLLLSFDAPDHPAIVASAPAGRGPYVARFAQGGRVALVAALWSAEVISFAVTDNHMRELRQVPVSRMPEGLDVSPDGEWAAVSCMAGFGRGGDAPAGEVAGGEVYLLNHDMADGGFRIADRLPVAGGPQFAMFTPDGKRLAVADTVDGLVSFVSCEGGLLRMTDVRFVLSGKPVGAVRGE